ncbi:MAG: hypothetical protein MR360_01075 [Ruminococcus sp.]|nr:hypothetical protein [Ruminococcus sp.]MCI5597899.1 hypothetical protein [Ruminococcus sp.]
MYNVNTKEMVLSTFHESTKKMFDEATVDFDLKSSMEKGDVDGIRAIIKNVQNIMIACTPDGLLIPKVSLHISLSGEDEVNLVNIKISNKIHAEKKFGFKITITKEKSIEKVFSFMEDVYSVLLVDQLIEENLKVVNDLLVQVVAESGITYDIKVVSSLGIQGKVISYMSDDEIVFVADESRILDLDDIIVLLDEPTEFISKELIAQHKKALVKELSTATTPEQLVKIHGGSLISYLINVRKSIQAMTLIKKVCNKNAKRLYGNKDAIAYYLEDDVFAIVARRDGNMEVILSPFDTKTFHKVDVDVLKKLA